jgi:predicted DNA-binding transcriptional regulator AlpA
MSAPETMAYYEGEFKMKPEISDKEKVVCCPAKNLKTHDKLLISLTELAHLFGKGRTTIYEWLYSEQLPPAAKIINGRRYWTVKQIDDFLNSGQNMK